MAVIFGDKRKDGWLTVTQIQYQMEKHPDGHTVKIERIPPYPPRKPGVGWVQLFNPKTKRFRYEKVEVPLTKEESLQEIAAAIRELAEAVRAAFVARSPRHAGAANARGTKGAESIRSTRGVKGARTARGARVAKGARGA